MSATSAALTRWETLAQHLEAARVQRRAGYTEVAGGCTAGGYGRLALAADRIGGSAVGESNGSGLDFAAGSTAAAGSGPRILAVWVGAEEGRSGRRRVAGRMNSTTTDAAGDPAAEDAGLAPVVHTPVAIDLQLWPVGPADWARHCSGVVGEVAAPLPLATAEAEYESACISRPMLMYQTDSGT